MTAPVPRAPAAPAPLAACSWAGGHPGGLPGGYDCCEARPSLGNRRPGGRGEGPRGGGARGWGGAQGGGRGPQRAAEPRVGETRVCRGSRVRSPRGAGGACPDPRDTGSRPHSPAEAPAPGGVSRPAWALGCPSDCPRVPAHLGAGEDTCCPLYGALPVAGTVGCAISWVTVIPTHTWDLKTTELHPLEPGGQKLRAQVWPGEGPAPQPRWR